MITIILTFGLGLVACAIGAFCETLRLRVENPFCNPPCHEPLSAPSASPRENFPSFYSTEAYRVISPRLRVKT